MSRTHWALPYRVWLRAGFASDAVSPTIDGMSQTVYATKNPTPAIRCAREKDGALHALACMNAPQGVRVRGGPTCSRWSAKQRWK